MYILITVEEKWQSSSIHTHTKFCVSITVSLDDKIL